MRTEDIRPVLFHLKNKLYPTQTQCYFMLFVGQANMSSTKTPDSYHSSAIGLTQHLDC